MKKAIAYTSDIIAERSGEVINRAYQKNLINQFAKENDIEVVAWFEDKENNEEILNRPGIKAMLAYEKPYDIVLVERVWTLSRNIGSLTGFIKVLIEKKAMLAAATYLWDAASQMVRRQLIGKAITPAQVQNLAMGAKAFRKVAVQKSEEVHSRWVKERSLVMKKAIAYTSDIIAERSGEVINRAYQKNLINRFAKENDIEVVAWFEDKENNEEILNRPGIKAMLAYEKPYDIVLVERVWTLSRNIGSLTGFIKVLIEKKAMLAAATYLWDAASQMVRRQLIGKAITPAQVQNLAMGAKAFRKVAVQKPEKFHFNWVFEPHPAK